MIQNSIRYSIPYSCGWDKAGLQKTQLGRVTDSYLPQQYLQPCYQHHVVLVVVCSVASIQRCQAMAMRELMTHPVALKLNGEIIESTKAMQMKNIGYRKISCRSRNGNSK